MLSVLGFAAHGIVQLRKIVNVRDKFTQACLFSLASWTGDVLYERFDRGADTLEPGHHNEVVG